MRHLIFRVIGGFKGIILIFVLAAGLTLHFYIQHLVNQQRDEARSLVNFYARMYARVSETESNDDISFIFEQIIRPNTFPLIITNANKEPISWKGIDISPNDTTRAPRTSARTAPRPS